MTTVDKNWLLLILTLIGMTFVAVTFAGASPAASHALIFPLVIVIELFVYFVAAMVTNQRATIGMAAGQALVLMLLRAVCSLGGGILYSLAAQAEPTSASFIYAWVNPVVSIIQVVILLFVQPYLMAVLIPDLVGLREAAELLGQSAKPSATSHKKQALDTTPSGGFIQVFSYEELAAVIKKSHGLEGFVIINNEGLVVWKDFPMRINMDLLASKVFEHSQALGDLVENVGLTKVRRVMLESREHFMFATTLDQNFGLILIFNGRVAPEEILSRIAILTKSCREYLQWKYPSLPLKAGAPKDITLETA